MQNIEARSRGRNSKQDATVERKAFVSYFSLRFVKSPLSFIMIYDEVK